MISRVVALSLFNNLFFNTTKILKIIMFEWILFIIYKKKKDFKKNEKEFNKLEFNLNFIKRCNRFNAIGKKFISLSYKL